MENVNPMLNNNIPAKFNDLIQKALFYIKQHDFFEI